MAMSEKFKSLDPMRQRILVRKVKRLYEAGVTAEEIARGFNKDLGLIEEAIEMIEPANKWKSECHK